jgi:hypothetical protein
MSPLLGRGVSDVLSGGETDLGGLWWMEGWRML